MPPQSNQGRSAYHDVPLDSVLAEVRNQPACYKLNFFLIVLFLDAVTSIICFSPLVPT
jgi:hypothetical protein